MPYARSSSFQFMLFFQFTFGKTNTIQKLELSWVFSYEHVFQVLAESMEHFCLRNQKQWELNV